MSIWVDCRRCNSGDKMYYRSKKANREAKYRKLQRFIQESQFLQLKPAAGLSHSLCLHCLEELVGWIGTPGTRLS